ncbi:MAG: TRAP transporter TAXI family solute receptor [Verrucomicrobiales bacterium]|jgi:TRAP transporter TAXI family solute receptor
MPLSSDRYRRLRPILFGLAILLLVVLPWLLLFRAENRSYQLSISTGQAGGIYQPLAEGIAEVVRKDHPRLNFESRPSDGSVMSMQRLECGECDLALLQNGTPGGDGVRLIAPLYEEVLHILVPIDSASKQLRDLRGRRLAVGPKQSGTLQVVLRLFEHYGLDEGEFDPVFTDMSDACEKLLTGEVDAVCVVAGVRADAIRRALAGGEARLMGIGKPGQVGSEVEGLRLHYPNLTPYVIPINTYPSEDEELGRPREPVQTLAVPSLLVCRADLPDRVVNQITRSIFDNRAQLIRQHPAAGRIRAPSTDELFSYPLHPGAEAYYRRDEPSFLVKYAEVIALLLSIAFAAWGVVMAVRRWVVQKKKDRIDEYYVRIEEILTKLQDGSEPGLEQLRAMERDLTSLRHKAVQQLVAEKLQANETFSIFQTLLASSQAAVRRRIDSLGLVSK